MTANAAHDPEEPRMSETRKRVLIVTYAFPPNGAVGSMRPLRFCRYLGGETR